MIDVMLHDDQSIIFFSIQNFPSKKNGLLSTSSSNWPYVVISSMQQNHVAAQQIQKKLAYLVSTPYWIPPKTKKQRFNSEQKKLDVFLLKSIQPFPMLESRKCCNVVHFSNSLLDGLKLLFWLCRFLILILMNNQWPQILIMTPWG